MAFFALTKRPVKIPSMTPCALALPSRVANRKEQLLRIAATVMAFVAAVWLVYEFWRLLWQIEPLGAIDLKTVHGLVGDWFAGRPVYSLVDAIHPPATYVLLWPFVGWLEFTPARWLWAATSLAALGYLALLVVRESGAETREERTVAALMPLSAYATGAAIGNGQITVHILPLLISGLLLLRRPQSSWQSDALAGFLILLTLVKPTISAPFFWIVLFSANSRRPAWLAGLGYIALTALALGFQTGDLSTLAADWQARSSAVAVMPGHGNVSNLHIWLSGLGMAQWILPASLVVLAVLGAWIYRHRQVDLWLLIGVTAYVARFWSYHRWYDDLLILLPIVALFRLTKGTVTRSGTEVCAGILLVVTMLSMLAPGGLFLLPQPWNTRYVAAQVVIWLAGLIFLAARAHSERQSVLT